MILLRPSLAFSFILSYVVLVSSQNGPSAWNTSPFNPFSIPIAIRNPYLNGWLSQGNNPGPLGTSWTSHWSNAIAAWFVAIVVDGQGYVLSGIDTDAVLNGTVKQKSIIYTPTSTIFALQAGNMDVNLTFLSPIEPEDLLRQSLPFSYMYISAESNDGNDHQVRLYSDITGEWLMAAPGRNVSWNSNVNGPNIILSQQFTQPVPFMEISDHAIDSTEYLSFRRINGTNVSWQISSPSLRDFAANTTAPLNDTADSGERILSDNFPVLGIEIDWGEIQQTPTPAVFALGVVRDPVVQYKLHNETIQMRSHYYRSSFDSDVDAINFFLSDFERAQQAAATFDNDLQDSGNEISENYAELLALTARQILGSIDITIAKGSDGNWNFSDTLVFMKNLGAAGSDSPTESDLQNSNWTQSVNTVDTLFAAFPAFLYFNPEITGYLLKPLLDYQDSDAYIQPYAAKNIGSGYPNATADTINAPHPYQLEETANMIIMVLAYSQFSGNNTLIDSHYDLLHKWGQYLVDNAREPSGQLWADYVILQNNLPTNNQTNLALKGIIALSAMSKIASIAGNDGDSAQFNSTAASYIQFWKENAFTGSQINYFYGDTINNGLLYNLYADILLDLGFVPDDVYDSVTTSYNSLITNDGGTGLPLMSNFPDLTSISAMMLSAATVTNNVTRNEMISQVHAYASSNFNNTPLGGYYNPVHGSIINDGIGYNGNGINSPTIGGVFSLLVKGNTTVKAFGSQGSTNAGAKSKPEVRSILLGGIFGGVAALILLGAGAFFIRRRRHMGRRGGKGVPDVIASANERDIIEPFNSEYALANGTNRNTYMLLPAGNEKGSRGNVPTLITNTTDTGTSHITGTTATAMEHQRVESSGSTALLGMAVAKGDQALRDEMEALRREVERIRQRDVETVSEAPPSYAEDIS